MAEPIAPTGHPAHAPTDRPGPPSGAVAAAGVADLQGGFIYSPPKGPTGPIPIDEVRRLPPSPADPRPAMPSVVCPVLLVWFCLRNTIEYLDAQVCWTKC